MSAHILHTNDQHGRLGTFPQIAALIQQYRTAYPNTLLVDTGDLGLARYYWPLIVSVLQHVRYDAIVPGNLETQLPDSASAADRLTEVGAPLLAANLEDWWAPSQPVLVVTCGDLTIGLLGLTTPLPYPPGHPLAPTERPPGTPVITDPIEVARVWVPRLRQMADAVVVLSHLGLAGDLPLARAVPDIDLIIGGHSHHRLASPIRVGRTSIVQAGLNNMAIGWSSLRRENGSITAEYRLLPVTLGAPRDAVVEELIRHYLERCYPEKLEVIAHTEGFGGDHALENGFSNLVTDILRHAAGADIFLTKASFIVPPIEPGPLRRWDLEMHVFLATASVVVMELTGEEVLAALEHGATDPVFTFLPPETRMEDARLIEAAEVRPATNFLYQSGMRLLVDYTRPWGERVVQARIGRSSLRRERTYTVAMDSFLAQGYSGFHWFTQGRSRREVGKVMDLLVDELQRRARAGPLRGRLDGRLHMRGLRFAG
jgi:2',3'-cyclic-nucleotide 2'-phosphodiesterase (5'-nucleotidase family)